MQWKVYQPKRNMQDDPDPVFVHCCELLLKKSLRFLQKRRQKLQNKTNYGKQIRGAAKFFDEMYSSAGFRQVYCRFINNEVAKLRGFAELLHVYVAKDSSRQI